MLVPATAEDLRVGGKIVLKNEAEDGASQVSVEMKTDLKELIYFSKNLFLRILPGFYPCNVLSFCPMLAKQLTATHSNVFFATNGNCLFYFSMVIWNQGWKLTVRFRFEYPLWLL